MIYFDAKYFQLGSNSYCNRSNVFSNKGEPEGMTWTAAKIDCNGKQAVRSGHLTSKLKIPRCEQFQSEKEQSDVPPSTSILVTMYWCVGFCMSAIIIVALFGIQCNSRYMISRDTFLRRRRQR